MKILFWADGFWPRIGGAETYGLQFVEGMQKRGHLCRVLTQKDDSNWKEFETYRNISIQRLDFDALLQKRDLKNIRRIQECLARIAEEFQPDMIYLNTLARGSALAFLLFRKLFRIPVIARVHSPYWETLPVLVKQICSSLDQICCVSNWVLNVMETFLPSCKEKLKLVYNGLPMPILEPTPLPFSPPIVLLLGRLSFEKGFDTAIQAFALLKKTGFDAQLLIAGEGTDRPFLEQLVDQLGLREMTQFTGAVQVGGAAFLINRATLVVMPSHFEAFGFVAVEAMQMQRPVIASDVGGLREIVSHQETGLLVPPRDPWALCRAMEEVLGQPTKAVEMGIRGRKRAMEHYSLEENLDRYEELFKKLEVCR